MGILEHDQVVAQLWDDIMTFIDSRKENSNGK
jgi:hypothetical protein